jgi:histidine triad (HIT) family protein
MTDCIFCKIVQGTIPSEFIYQDDKVVVFKDIRPKARIHLLVVSKDHIKSLAEVSEEQEDQKGLMAHMLCLLPKLAKQQGLKDGFRTVINTGAGGGQEIDHIHFHLLGGGTLPRM